MSFKHFSINIHKNKLGVTMRIIVSDIRSDFSPKKNFTISREKLLLFQLIVSRT